jgi:hypothetical protein
MGFVSANAKVDQTDGPVSVQMTIIGAQLETDADIYLKPTGQPLVTSYVKSKFKADIPVTPNKLPGLFARCTVIITADAANQPWQVLFEASQNGKSIGKTSDRGQFAAKGNTDASTLNLVFK